jgi:hypothetical protein
LQVDGTKDNGCGNRQGHHSDICGREEVGQHDPIGVEQQEQKLKQKQKQKLKQKQTQNQQCGSKVTTSVPADSYANTAAAAASA